MRRLLVTALLLGLASLAISACGGDDDEGGGLSKDEYITQVDAICEEADQRETDAGAPGATGEIKTNVLEEVVAIDGEALADIQELEAPEDDEDAAKVVSDVEAVVSTREDQLEAVRAKNPGAESDAENAFFAASSDLGASAGAYGLTHCQALGF